MVDPKLYESSVSNRIALSQLLTGLKPANIIAVRHSSVAVNNKLHRWREKRKQRLNTTGCFSEKLFFRYSCSSNLRKPSKLSKYNGLRLLHKQVLERGNDLLDSQTVLVIGTKTMINAYITHYFNNSTRNKGLLI